MKILSLIRILFILFILVQNLVMLLHAQSVIRDTSWTITQAQDSGYIFFAGTQDPENTRFMPGHTEGYYSAESMRYLRITNTDSTPSFGAKFLLNRRGNWYSRQEMAVEALGNAQTEKEKSLSLFEFVRQNRVHYDPAEEGHLDETHEPLKVLGVYGFGLCDDAAFSVSNIANSAGISANELGITAHNITEIAWDNPSIVDADLEVFYPGYNNSNLAGKNDLTEDRYLISRILHNGQNFPYNLDYSKHIASMFVSFNNILYRNPTPHQFYFTLLPGQSVTFSWLSTDSIYEHRIYGSPATPQMREKIIANAFWDHCVNPFSPGFQYHYHAASNLQVDTSGLGIKLRPLQFGTPLQLVHKIDLPFPQLDNKVYFSASLPTVEDSIIIEWSLDSLNWIRGYSVAGPFSGIDSCSLYNQILTQANAAVYLGFIRVIVLQADSLRPAGLDSIHFQTRTQNSKLFLPFLKSGQNFFHFSRKDSLLGKHQIDIGWIESTNNNPPVISNVPVYPGNGITADTSRILFRWGNAQDPDWDPIRRYQFQLSDRSDMAYPLAPNFERMINPTPPATVPFPSFNPEVTGFFNHGQTYYWRVRAMDSQGLWGPWTNTWSFTVNCVMPPVLGSLSLTDTALVLNWHSGQPGKNPVAYEVHGSSELNGFTPTNQTLLAVTTDSFYSFNYNQGIPPTHIRIVALDSNGETSQPSRVITSPFPFVFTNSSPTIYPDSLFVLPLMGNYRFFQYFAFFYPDTIHHQAWVSPTQYPNFLNWDFTLSELSAVLDSATIRRMLFDPSLRNISFQVIAPYTQPVNQSISLTPSLENRKPLLEVYSPGNIGLGSFIQDTLYLLDRDADFGDTHSWQLLNIPTWLTTQTTNEYIVIGGTPTYSALADTLLYFIVQDSYGLEDTLLYEYHFSMVNNAPTILSAPDTLVDPNLLYEYSISVYDPDTVLGDSVALSIQQGPFWLYLNTVNQKLQGYPIVAQGADSLIRIRATDLAGAWVEQDFILHFKRRLEVDTIDTSGTSIPDELLGEWNEADGNGISVFPNPTQDITHMRLKLPTNGTILIQLYTLEGKFYAEIVSGYRESGIRQLTFNSAAIASGAYWVRMSYITDSGEEYQFTEKLIVLH